MNVYYPITLVHHCCILFCFYPGNVAYKRAIVQGRHFMDGNRTVDGHIDDRTRLRYNTPDRNILLTIDLGREHRVSLVALYFRGCCEYIIFTYIMDVRVCI